MDEHRKDRAFYDMSGESNVYKYMTTEGKIYGEDAQKYTMLQYLQKSTGVFNQHGMLSKEQVKEIKKRAQSGEKNLWHGFISFNEEDSRLIDTLEKCIALIKKTFGQFFRDAGFDPDNMDLLCALHLDKPKHLHIHYLFFEKEPKVKNKRAAGYTYRKKGKIKFDAIEKMTERLNAYTLDNDLDKRRDAVIDALQKNSDYAHAHINDVIRKWLRELADELPKDKPLWYASKDMAKHRPTIDLIAEWLIGTNPDAEKADKTFREELKIARARLQDKMGGWYKKQADNELHFVQNMEGYTEVGNGMKTLHTIEAVEWDYGRRLGNIVLRHVRDIQKETYKRNPNRQYKTNDKTLKRNLTISARKIRGITDGLFASVFDLFNPHTSACHNRLKEIEQEIEEKRKHEEVKANEEVKPNTKYNWTK